MYMKRGGVSFLVSGLDSSMFTCIFCCNLRQFEENSQSKEKTLLSPDSGDHATQLLTAQAMANPPQCKWRESAVVRLGLDRHKAYQGAERAGI